jgi:ATP synthase protein I
MFGPPSVPGPDSLAKNFTSARFLAVETPPERPSPTEPTSRKPLSSGSEFAGLGLQMGATLGLSAWLGYWLDGRLGTTPWLTILMVFVGAGAAFYSIYRKVLGPPR